MATVRVRIAVAVNPNGYWKATGYSDFFFVHPTNEESAEREVRVEAGKDAVVHWVEATLQVPEPQTIEGEVSTA